MTKVTTLLVVLSFFSSTVFSQVMNTKTYRDLTIAYIETNLAKYDFEDPLCANILDSLNFSPPGDGTYLKATFGTRYLGSSSSPSDNHGGFDFWDEMECGTTSYGELNKAPIVCMCDGVISEVIHGTDAAMELLGGGRSVQVTCDSVSQAFNEKIKINYRHLSALGSRAAIAYTAPINSIRINKGDNIGVMGESGKTSSLHLHLSAEIDRATIGTYYLHTARLFNPIEHPGVLEPLTNAKIELLHDWPDSALFRVVWPFNQTINRFEFSVGSSFQAVFDKEEAYEVGSSTRDDFDCVPGFQIYAYKFNGKKTAKERYEDVKGDMPAIYPASPERDNNLSIYNYSHIPIVHDSVAFVYDFVVENLPASHSLNDIVVKVSDVWGYTVEGTLWANTINEKSVDYTAKIFPNPTSSEITLAFNAVNEPKKIDIINLHGKLIHSIYSIKMNETINMDKLSPGIYVVKIQTQNKLEMHRVIRN